MKITVTNSWCKVDLEGRPVPQEILKVLSYVDKQQSFQSYRWTGRYDPVIKCLYNKRNNAFPTGLLPLVMGALGSSERPEIIDERISPTIDWQAIPPEIADYGEGHQRIALETMQDSCRGTVEGITAMGKTFVEAGFATSFPGNVLILSHRREIFDNIVRRCNDYCGSSDIGIISANKVRPARVSCAMVGTLSSRIASLKSYLNQVDAILVDESHHCSIKSQYFPIIQACGRAYYRFGLTATPWRESGDTISVFAGTGPIIYSYDYHQAVSDGVVVPLEVYLAPITTNLKLPILFTFHDVYEIGIVKNDERNAKIVKIAKHLHAKGENVLILVWQLDHGRRISKMLDDTPHEFVHGSSPNRASAKEDFENGDLPILVASSIYDEGVNIERVENVIIAAGYKSERLLVQRTGRGMRTFEGKKKCRIFDFMDLSHDMLTRHSRARLKYYKKQKFQIKQLEV